MRPLILCLLVCSAALAEFEIYLKDSNKIPLYAQETGYWCGAGSGQMVLEGFPDDLNHTYKQKYVWDEIQKVKVETDWYTDPDGLKNVLTLLGKGSHWEATCAKTTAIMTKLVLDGLYQRKYPVPVLVYGHDHWVVVIGATTEEHPMLTSTIKLKRVEAHDPWKAQHILVDGNTWLNKYWNGKGTSGKWSQCYVAVHEVEVLPDTDAKLVTDHQPKRGTPISSELALEKAKQFLKEISRERSEFDLKDPLQEPIFVSHEKGDYYLVPIGSAGAMMVNAYSGEWEGISRFGVPQRFPRLRQPGRWIFHPSQESRSPFHPVYMTSTGYIDLDGNASSVLHELGRGN